MIAEFVKQAQARLEEAQKAHNEEIANLLNAADSAYTSGQFATAATRYQAVLAIDATNEDARKGAERSIAKFDELIASDMTKASQAEKLNKHDEAIAGYQAVLEICPGNNDAKEGIVRCRKIKEERVRKLLDTAIDFYNSGDFDQAESRFKAVLALEKGNTVAQSYLARFNQSQKSKTEPGSARTSTNYASTYQLGVNAYTARDYSTAITYWSQIPEDNAYYSNAQINIARAQAILQEFNR